MQQKKWAAYVTTGLASVTAISGFEHLAQWYNNTATYDVNAEKLTFETDDVEEMYEWLCVHAPIVASVFAREAI